LNKVFIIGGSRDKLGEQLSGNLFEWNLITNFISRKPSHPLALIDSGSCYINGYLYSAGGYLDITLTLFFNEDTFRYSIVEEKWEKLP
jgi:hypothetical protein